ncbi:hypothetical protein [Isoalcanivorax indicus]|uniref:hypothetical protein n=1 Tax=Isoalcanivorax indicus TaxID=2202653 RepID=UPI000DB931AD|nr:hypothetical protein [Isoalcanivorax indicus]
MHRFAALASLCLLAACSHYQAPYGADTAEVTFTSNNVTGQPAVCDDQGKLRNTRRALAAVPFEAGVFHEINQSLGKDDAVTVSVPAGDALTLGVRHGKRTRGTTDFRCREALQFTPRAGEHYQVHFMLDSGVCGIGVTTADGDPVDDARRVGWSCP